MALCVDEEAFLMHGFSVVSVAQLERESDKGAEEPKAKERIPMFSCFFSDTGRAVRRTSDRASSGSPKTF